ncbi:MAG: hypothetical protein DCC55_05850 [Chloroflexi bacterium]|nr:MAG: hypothetical protein DCC55_05850 [Chloroflexota bacterium]
MLFDVNLAKTVHNEYEMRLQEHRMLRAVARIRRERQGAHPFTLAYRRVVNWLQSNLNLADAQRSATPVTNPQTPCLDC